MCAFEMMAAAAVPAVTGSNPERKMPQVINYRRGPDEADRQAARKIKASRREALIVFGIFLLIVALTVLRGLYE